MNTPTGPILVALYARVSTERQKKEATIASQIKELRERVAAEGWAEAGLYIDDGYSGSTLVRPGLDRLRDDARKGLFTRVLILTPDRLSRGDPFDAMIVTRELAKLGIPITFCNREHDETPTGELMDDLEKAVAKYERRLIAERTRRGKLHKIAEGHVWRPRPPFGYRYVLPEAGAKHGHLEVVEEERPVVRAVFDHILAGKPLRWVAAELMAREVPTRRGGVWNNSRVWNMVANPIYSGNATYNRWAQHQVDADRKRSAYSKQPSHRQRPREEWILVSVPAIVTPEEQAAAQAILARNKVTSKGNSKHDYLLRGVVCCGLPHRETGQPCGNRMGPQQGSKSLAGGVYRCTRGYPDPSRHRTPRCKGSISCRALDTMVWDHLAQMLLHPDILQQIDAAGQDSRLQLAQFEEALSATLRGVEAVQQKLDTLLEKNLDGAVDDETYKRRQVILVDERDAARALAVRARDALAAAQGGERRWRDVRRYCESVSANLERLDFAQRIELVRTLIQQVIVGPDTIQIVGVLPAVNSDNPSVTSTHYAHRRRPPPGRA